jgi:hypothetical protein
MNWLISKQTIFLKRGWDNALSDGDAAGQAHKGIALLVITLCLPLEAEASGRNREMRGP